MTEELKPKLKRSYKRSIKVQTKERQQLQTRKARKALADKQKEEHKIKKKSKKAFNHVTRQNKSISDMVQLNQGLVQKENLSKTSAIEPMKEQVDFLMLEWAMFYSGQSVRHFVMVTKSYSEGAYAKIMQVAPAEEWKIYKEQARAKLSKDIYAKHIDVIAEVNDQHLTFAKLGLQRVGDLFLKGSPIMSKLKLKKGRTGINGNDDYIIPVEIGRRPLYPKEIADAMNAFKTIIQTYRTILGLPNDEGAVQVYESIMKQQAALSMQQQNNIQINQNITLKDGEQVETLKQTMENLTYDDLMVFIKHKRAKANEN